MTDNELKPIVIIGATATGKSSLGIKLAADNGEIVSGDSMQIYRRMDIGTAKPDKSQLSAVRHHLIDIADIDEPFSAERFLTLAKEAISGIVSRGRRPVLVGGTGFYIESLISGVEFAKAEGDKELRESLFKKAETLGPEALYEELKKADPESAAAIHPNNVKRVVRALELLSVTGKTKTELNAASKKNAKPLDCDVIYLSYGSRDDLYAKINARVDKMFGDGLEDEVRSLWEDGLEDTPTASQAIGYKEFFPYFKGALSLDEVKENIKQATRNYAKRQETYFNRMANIYGNIKKTEPENPKC